MAKKDRKNLLLSGVLILTISNIIVKAIGLLYKIPLHSLLGDTGMGYFNAAYRIYTMFYMVSTAGLPVAVSIMISESRAKGRFKEVKTIFKVTLTLFCVIGLAGSSIMFFGSRMLASLIKLEASYYCMMAIAPTLFFICICSAVRGYFQGYQNMLPTAISQIMEAAGKLGLGMIFAFWAKSRGMEYNQIAAFALLGLTLGVLAGTVFILIYKALFKDYTYDAEFAHVGEDTSVRPVGTLIKALLLIAVPVTLSSSVMSISDAVDVVIISRRLQHIGMTEEFAASLYGNYTTLAVPLYNLPPVLIYPISYSIIPYISAALAENDNKKAKDVMTRSLKIAGLIAIPSALGLSALSKPILSLIFGRGKSVDMAAPLLSILAIAVFFVGMISVTSAILQSNKLQRVPIISMACGGLVKLASSFFLIGNSNIGIYGAPIGTCLCYFTITVINFAFIAKKIKLIPNFVQVFFKPFAASFLCVLAAVGIYKIAEPFNAKLATLASIAVAVVIYLIAILLIRAITKEDIELIPKGKKIYGVLHRLRLMK